MNTVRLNGLDLTIAEIVAVARERVVVELDPAARAGIRASADLVAEVAWGPDAVYGVNTGFGDLAQIRIAPPDLRRLQQNLLRSHAAGVGPDLPADVVRALLLLRANTLASGYSGVRLETIGALIDLLNADVIPCIPMHGSVGASGDLAPLAHAALVLIGEGEAWYRQTRLPGRDALAAAGLRPIELAPKEGVALINGTQVMTAIGALALHDAELLAVTADIVGALSAEALRATDRSWDEGLNRLRRHAGQQVVAANLRALMGESPNVAGHRSGDPRVQDPYSIRCMPQVHGASRDALSYVRTTLQAETNSVTDNPLVFAARRAIVSGGNFHGQPVAIALDLGTIAVAELADIAEARVDRLTNGHTSGLPAFLSRHPGTDSGLMIAQYTAAALVVENRLRSAPASIESISTSAGMEDHVSMGVHAAHKFAAVVRTTADVLAIEALCAAQGLDLLGAKTNDLLRGAYQAIRAIIPTLDRDRPLAADIARASEAVRSGVLAKAVGVLVR